MRVKMLDGHVDASRLSDQDQTASISRAVHLRFNGRNLSIMI